MWNIKCCYICYVSCSHRSSTNLFRLILWLLISVQVDKYLFEEVQVAGMNQECLVVLGGDLEVHAMRKTR